MARVLPHARVQDVPLSPPATVPGADPDVLLRSLADGDAGARLERTHCNWVVLAGDRAYKLPRPVRYDFVDQSTRAARRAACEEQVALNAPLAPGLARGVRAIVPEGDHYALADADHPDAIDHLVEMVRYDEGRTLAALVRAGEATTADAAAAGAALARFHLRAPRHRRPLDHRAVIDRNTEALLPLVGDLVGAGELLALQRFLDAFLLGWQDVLAARADAGLVIEGHGDVRAEHILLEDDGVRIVDRLEIGGLRVLDVADELAFLATDLELLGARRLVGAVLDGYASAGGPRPPARLLGFFGAYRAMVRAKVALLREPGSARTADEVRTHLRIARRMAWRARGPMTLVICGPPASGKSTLAAAIGRVSGLRVLASDDVRGDAGRDYSPEGRRRIYEELGRLATAERAVIVDATFGDPGLQEAFAGAFAANDQRTVLAVECVAPLLTREARAELRALRGGATSDADADVARRLAATHAPPIELGATDRLAIDTTVPIDLQVDQVESWLDTQLTSRDLP